MKIQTILWDTVGIWTTDKKSGESWNVRNATVNIYDGSCHIKEYNDRNVTDESTKSLFFGDPQILELRSHQLIATAKAIYTTFHKNTGKTSRKIRPVKIVASF